MFAILFRVLAKPGKQQELIDFLKWDCEYCDNNEEGTLRFDLLYDPENENAFYVYEAYKDRAAFQTHMENPPFMKWDKGGLKEGLVALYVELFKGEPLCIPKNLRSVTS